MLQGRCLAEANWPAPASPAEVDHRRCCSPLRRRDAQRHRRNQGTGCRYWCRAKHSRLGRGHTQSPFWTHGVEHAVCQRLGLRLLPVILSYFEYLDCIESCPRLLGVQSFGLLRPCPTPLSQNSADILRKSLFVRSLAKLRVAGGNGSRESEARGRVGFVTRGVL